LLLARRLVVIREPDRRLFFQAGDGVRGRRAPGDPGRLLANHVA
jgi:hypothetical protein